MSRRSQYDVLLVSPTSVPGGSERALTSLAQGLVERGMKVRAALLSDGVLRAWLEKAGCPVEVVEMGRTRELHKTAVTVARLARLARGARLVIGNQSKGHVIAGSAALVARRPSIWWQHGVADRSSIEAVAAKVPARAVVCGSRFAAEAQRRATPGHRIELIHPGSDLARIRSQPIDPTVRQRLGDGLVVGMLARLQPWKGQEMFLRAAREIAAEHPEVTFAVVGGAILGWEGEYPNHLRELAQTLSISERVLFTGHQIDAYSWLHAFDVAVTVSTGEPFGLVTVEAMALGRPVVGTRSGATPEIVEEGRTGLLVAPGDHLALAREVSGLLENPQLRRQLGRAASERANLFSSDVMTTRFCLLFEELSSSR